MNPEYASQMNVGLLTLSLTSVLAVGILLALAIIRYIDHKRRTAGKPRPNREEGLEFSTESDVVALAENPIRWLAVKSSNPIAVQAALGLQNARVCSWAEGVVNLSEQSLFISPPIDGWLLVVGPGLPDPFEDIDECYRFMLKLAREMGHVQFFSANGAVNHHAWARMEGERVVRAYAWAGETLWNQGKRSMAEMELGMKCLDYGEGLDGFVGENHSANTEKVTALAARWSLDPTHLNERRLVSSQGIAGDLLQFKRH